jgi:hypothetical protein
MARARTFMALIGLALATAGCGGAPPRELSGLWSAGQASCAAGVGVRFTSDAIEAVYDERREVLFEHPRYQRIGQSPFRVRIIYDLPRLPGGAHVAGARGLLVLTRQPDGTIVPQVHNLLDARTGAARLPLRDDPAVAALTLAPCAGESGAAALRGRDAGGAGS